MTTAFALAIIALCGASWNGKSIPPGYPQDQKGYNALNPPGAQPADDRNFAGTVQTVTGTTLAVFDTSTLQTMKFTASHTSSIQTGDRVTVFYRPGVRGLLHAYRVVDETKHITVKM